MRSMQASGPESPKHSPRQASAPRGAPGQGGAPKTAPADAQQREALIRVAAYSLYERRGHVCGHEIEDWLQAEMEVDRQLNEGKESRQTN